MSIRPPPRSRSGPTRCRRSSTGSRCGCARSPSPSTAPASPATRPPASRWRSAGTATAESGPSVAAVQAFQVGGCAALPFKPRLALRLSGAARPQRPPCSAGRRSRARPGEANIARASAHAARHRAPGSPPHPRRLHPVRYACRRRRALPAPASRYGRVRRLQPAARRAPRRPAVPATSADRPSCPTWSLRCRRRSPASSSHGQTLSLRSGLLRVRLPTLPDVPLAKVVVQLSRRAEAWAFRQHHRPLSRGPAASSVSFLAHNGNRAQLEAPSRSPLRAADSARHFRGRVAPPFLQEIWQLSLAVVYHLLPRLARPRGRRQGAMRDRPRSKNEASSAR